MVHHATSLVKDYWILIRPRIIGLVLFGMAAAAFTAGPHAPAWPQVLHALLGTAAVIAGAIAMNQRIEHLGDARMPRTAERPLPSGHLTLKKVVWFACLATAAGLAYLAWWTGPLVTGLAAASWVIYVAAYTPLKSRSAWQTPVGAVAGAMPMLLGAAVASPGESSLGPMAWTLFGIVFFWQFPHAMAIAWLYRDQFASAEVKLATVIDPSGRRAGVLAILGAAVLLPIGLAPCWLSPAGWGYGATAIVLGVGYLAASVAFLVGRSDATARLLLRASLVYLTVLLLVLLAS
jgi:protoheme IX farnesyltransferase